jgi:hypothetical protein
MTKFQNEQVTFALQQVTVTKLLVDKNKKVKCICDVIYYAKQQIYCKEDTIYCKIDTIYFFSSTIPSCEVASTAKSEWLITSSCKMSDKKIASTTCQANQRIEISQLEVEHLQLECTQQARAAVKQDKMVVTLTCDHATEIDMLKCQHKTALCDTQAKHVLRLEKQKLGMTGEMNQLRELLFGQNEMIDGCLDEMRDECKAAWLVLASANQLKIAATGKMEKVKWWKGKCDELKWLNYAYIRQSMKIEEMQLKINE